MSADTVDVEQAAAIPELDETQATRHGIELYATSSGRNRTAVTDNQHVANQKASRNKSTEKVQLGGSIILLVFFGLVLLLSLAGIAFERGVFVWDWLDNDAKFAFDRDLMENASKQDQAESASKQGLAENASKQDLTENASKLDQAESAIGQTQEEIDILKQDLANMEQQIKDIQDERDAALAKAMQEKEQREKQKQAALDAANRERDAQAAAALAAHNAQQAAQKAEKLAIKHSLEKQRLTEQRERLKQASQQAESRRNLLEEQRKLLVLEWERLAEEKAKLEKTSLPESDSE
ncbi:MAG: hypothetical protein HKP12_00760 [Gammaproteobacteria bacterium]|nr:hypothetical protein [Gammaproteobacteria bacterium]